MSRYSQNYPHQFSLAALVVDSPYTLIYVSNIEVIVFNTSMVSNHQLNFVPHKMISLIYLAFLL